MLKIGRIASLSCRDVGLMLEWLSDYFSKDSKCSIYILGCNMGLR